MSKLLGSMLILASLAMAQASQHTVTFTFNYDFTVDNACSITVLTGCVKQFNFYDLANPTVKLFIMVTPAGANTSLIGISGTTPLITLKAGNHSFVATAQMADGTESVNSNTASVVVKPNSPTNLVPTVP